MHSTLNARRSRTAVAMLAAGLAAHSFAQAPPTCGVLNRVRLVNKINGGTTQDLLINTGWLAAPPAAALITPASSSDAGALGTTAGSWNLVSDYGRLTIAGSMSANNVVGNGVFCWIDDGAGSPQAQFRDRITITSASLPVGTPVTVRMTGTLAGSASVSDPAPGAAPSLRATFFRPPTIGASIALTSPGQFTEDSTLHVGDARDIFATLNCVIRLQRLENGTPVSDTASANLTATYTLEILTPGAAISTCSGAAYLPCTTTCYANCDCSAVAPLLSAGDFTCFITKFRAGDAYANCDGSTGSPLLTAADFTCFLNAFRAGCP